MRASRRRTARFSTKLEVACSYRCELGEGPAWDERDETLWWVDIDGHQLLALNASSSSARSFDLEQPVTMVVPRLEVGLVIALARSLVMTDEQLSITHMIPMPIPRSETLRLNDGGCDSAGRLWVGSMATDGSRHRSALFRVERDHHVAIVRDRVSVSNGLGWAPNGRTMYYVDTPTAQIEAIQYDVATGGLADTRALARLRPEQGRPDGLCVDAEGCVWVALWGGGAVHRYTPYGRLDMRIELPVTNVTSCCFGGRDLNQLFITTARRGLDVRARQAQPLAGSVFVSEPGIQGLPAARFAG
jgi:sugar lactone lactonase YvrE